MDDLKLIDGIGAATERKLVAAGIDTFAKLAKATPEQLDAAQISGGAKEWAGFILDAAKFLPQGFDLSAATQEEINAQAARLDNARLGLAQLAASVVTANDARLALADSTDLEAIAAADSTLQSAKGLLDGAIGEARILFGVSPDAPLPAALQEEIAAALSIEPVVEQSAPELLQNNAVEGVGALAESGNQPRDADLHLAAMERGADQELEELIANARNLAAKGDLAGALDGLRVHRGDMVAAQAVLARVIIALDGEIAALETLERTAPIERAYKVSAKVDSRYRIGRHFTKTPTTFQPGELAADELLALQSDPLMVVTEGEAA